MFSVFKKKTQIPKFEVDSPRLSITSSFQNPKALLENAGVKYKVVNNGYIVFEGFVFNCDIPLMIGIHFNAVKIEFIEIFRPLEYYNSENFDINVSFAELSKVLHKRYGNPIVTTSASINGYPCEQWLTSDYIVNHYIMDRFGPEEHLHINFFKK